MSNNLDITPLGVLDFVCTATFVTGQQQAEARVELEQLRADLKRATQRKAQFDELHQRLHSCGTSSELLGDLLEHLQFVNSKWKAFASAHEGYAVVLEELDELWEHVKAKQGTRDLAAMRKEAIDVAVAAIRFATDLCDEESRRR